MNDPFDCDDPIEERAAQWLTERAEGFSIAQRRDFERWCRADPRHAAAVARLEAACALLDKMPLVRAELQPVVEFPVRPRALARRKNVAVPRMIAAVAAALVLAALGWRQWGNRFGFTQLYATSAGGYERVVLTDGSIVELNANSEVRVDLLPGERRVALVRGEAHFTVAHNSARPFIVTARRVGVQAVGTAFNVRLASSAIEVLVTEGKVAVTEHAASTTSAPAPTLLAANERTLIPQTPNPAVRVATAGPAPAPVVERLTSEALREALAWQERKLVFSETPLREVVAQFNRRNRLQLLVGDAALAERPVGGTFAADNVEGFLRLLEGSGTITAERRDETTVVLRAAP